MRSLRPAVLAGLAGCAKSADQIGATYLSPITYENYTCPQSAEEAQPVTQRAVESAGIQTARRPATRWR